MRQCLCLCESMKEIPMENVMKTLLAVNEEEQFVHKVLHCSNIVLFIDSYL